MIIMFMYFSGEIIYIRSSVKEQVKKTLDDFLGTFRVTRGGDRHPHIDKDMALVSDIPANWSESLQLKSTHLATCHKIS